MSETLSKMIELGTIAPEFCLEDTVSGKKLSLNSLKAPLATVVVFLCNHCPYVKHIQHKLVEVATLYQMKGIRFIAINSNDVESYPQDAPVYMKQEAERLHYPFPYLFDSTQEVAKAYHAMCTPDFYIFDAHMKCVYRGRFDEATPGNKVAVTGTDLCQALDDILIGKSPSLDQKPSIGCNIKWKK